MAFGERAVLALYSLLIAALSLCILLVSAGWTLPLDLYEYTLTRTDYRALGAVAAGLLFVLSCRFLWSSLRIPAKKIETVSISRGTEGEITITSLALEQLVVRSARQVKGLREIKPNLKILPEGIVVALEISPSSDVSLPSLARELQEKVRTYLAGTAGLDVLEVQVVISGIAYESPRRVD